MNLPDAPNARSLETIRAELDEIDERIHALVVRRAGLADEVRHAKTDTGAAALRPAREAQMLRRIAGFDSGRMGLITLQPVSISGQKGLNIAGGIAAVSLKAAN